MTRDTTSPFGAAGAPDRLAPASVAGADRLEAAPSGEALDWAKRAPFVAGARELHESETQEE